MIKLIRNARVSAFTTGEGLNRRLAIEIPDAEGNQYQHEFPSNHRMSKRLFVASAEAIQRDLQGGTYFIVEGALIDYRDRSFRGYIHTDESLEKLVEFVGVERVSRSSLVRKNTIRDNEDMLMNRVFARGRNSVTTGNGQGLMLGSAREPFGIHVEGLGQGGDHQARVIMKWSPFRETVRSNIELLRMACANGMVAHSPVVNADIPLINDHEAHLAIAESQIQQRFGRLISQRLLAMKEERASVEDIHYAHNAARSRLEWLGDNPNYQNQIVHLNDLLDVTNPRHLGTLYNEGVLASRDRRAVLPGHLTKLDLWNILTEMDTHTRGDNGNGIQIRLNSMMFDPDPVLRIGQVALSRDSDPERAFFAASEAVEKAA